MKLLMTELSFLLWHLPYFVLLGPAENSVAMIFEVLGNIIFQSELF